MEERFAGLSPERAVYVAERVAGIASVAYASAFSQAVERAAGVQPPTRAERWRAVYAELERIAYHLDVIAKEAETTALYVGAGAVSDPQGAGHAAAGPAHAAAASPAVSSSRAGFGSPARWGSTTVQRPGRASTDER